MVLTISTTKFFLAEISLGDYNFHRWTYKPTEIYSVNGKRTCKPPELHTIMKKCNGTGLVLKICETKNNVWKKYELSIQNGIDNCTEIIKIEPDSTSLNNGHLSHKSLFYWDCGSFILLRDVKNDVPLLFLLKMSIILVMCSFL